MYTGGVSSLAEQIANQLQRKEQPKTLLDKKELVRYTKGTVCLDKTALVNKPALF